MNPLHALRAFLRPQPRWRTPPACCVPQALCLAVLWSLKLSPATALIFPSLIGVLMLVRAKAIPRLFTSRELMLLDTAIGQTSA